ncbi:MAG: hypothetical protein ACT6S0_04810 [Roseateles sp.]|uniref:hypothetical protein n=1 Tax=Roseateles sp. TaxID=1971397 RepID=UPI0040366884
MRPTQHPSNKRTLLFLDDFQASPGNGAGKGSAALTWQPTAEQLAKMNAGGSVTIFLPGSWTRWSGPTGESPANAEDIIDFVCWDGEVVRNVTAGSCGWPHVGSSGDIVGYRVVRPAALEFVDAEVRRVDVRTMNLYFARWKTAGGFGLTATVAANTESEALAELALSDSETLELIEAVGTMRGERYTRPTTISRDSL